MDFLGGAFLVSGILRVLPNRVLLLPIKTTYTSSTRGYVSKVRGDQRI
jgi:hypothetical protein